MEKLIEFLNENLDWFGEWSPQQMMAKLRNATPLVMNEYHVPQVATRMNKFWSKLQDQLTNVYKLLKNLYGLKDAGRTWF